MKEKRYRLKLKNNRIIGPFSKKDIGALYLKGRIEGYEKCQYFPVGDWKSLNDFKELADYIYEIVGQKSEEQKRDKGADEIKEFEYSKHTLIDVDYSELEKNLEAEKKDDDATKVVRRTFLPDIDKTLVKNPFPKETTEKEGDKQIQDLKQEKGSFEKKEEAMNLDAETKVLNVRSDMPLVQEEAKKFEMESMKEIKKKEVKTPIKKEKLKNKKIINKKKTTPIVAFSIFVILYFLLFDEGNESGINPKTFNIKVPVAHQVESKGKASRFFRQGKKLYEEGGYLNQLKAAEYFYLSVSHQYRENKALGYLIQTYAELYPNILEKDKKSSAVNLHRLVQTAISKQLKDVNITFGAAQFYHNINKHETAIYMIENYLRVSSPSKKLFCLYLDVLIAAEKLSKGKKALKKVKSIVEEGGSIPVEAYVSMSKFYTFNEEEDKALDIIKKGISKHPRSIRLLVEFAELKIKKMESLELSLKDPVFLKELARLVKILESIEERKAGYSPAYYAKYLEFTGVVSAIQGNSQTAAKLFKISLSINDSQSLRGKLATLNLGGGKAAEKLILENKIIDLMKRSKNALKDKKWKKAFAYAIEAVEYNKNYIPAQLLLVDVQRVRGYYDDAIRTLNDLKKVHKKNKDIYVRLVDTYLQVKKFKDAYQNIIEMNRIPKLRKTSEFASLQGKYFFNKGNGMLAAKWFKKSISQNPLEESNYFELAKIYLWNRNYAKSKSILLKALTLMPKKIKYHILYATILYEYDSPEVAIGYLRKILESEKDNKDILGQIAIFYYRNGQHKEFELYKEELEKGVLQNTLFYSFLVKASILDGNFEDVKKYSYLLLESDPADIEAQMLLGKALYDAGAYLQAIETFNNILEKLKSYPQVYYYLSKIYMEQKKFQDALVLAQKEIDGNPELYYGHYVKGEIYRRMGKWPFAIKNLEKAISIDANSVETLIALGWISLRQNFVERAQELYLRAKNRDENNPEVRKQLGLIYQSIGQDALAIDELKVYLQLKPSASDRRDIEFLIRRLGR